MTNQGYIPPKGSGAGNGAATGLDGVGDGMEMDEAEAMNGGEHGDESGYLEGEYVEEDDGMMGNDEYVHEAEWGVGREGGVDDDVPDND